MAQRPTRSLKHEYELFVEQEIENYKESIPRSVLLGIGDDAVSSLTAAPQFALTELLLCDEVDRIIFKRLRLPAYDTWRRRRVKLIDELRRPEHWGLRPDDVLVRTLPSATDGRVLVAGAADAVSALYLAANGCDVTTLTPESDALERVMQAAIGAGLAGRVHVQIGDLSSWTPEDSAQRRHRESVRARRDVIGRARQSHPAVAGRDGGRRCSPRADDPAGRKVERCGVARGASEPVSRLDGHGRAKRRAREELSGAKGSSVVALLRPYLNETRVSAFVFHSDTTYRLSSPAFCCVSLYQLYT